MNPREGEAAWKGELEKISASQKERRAAFEKELQDAYAKAEQRAAEMKRHTVERFQSSEQALLDAYEAETRNMAARAEELWNKRCSEAVQQDMENELRDALNAILGKGGRRDD
jgi:secreted Zn-dependent insulinase-like peptidase